MEKTPVRLRRKALKGGGSSLYLDIYAGGVRSYEFLRLYLVPERNEADRRQNRQTLAVAEAVRARRQAEVQSAAHGVRMERRGGPTLEAFLVAEGRPGYSALLYRVRLHRIGRMRISDITPHDYDDFLASMQHLSPNSRRQSAVQLKAAVRRAVRAGLCDTDVTAWRMPKGRDTEKCYLTAEELRALAAAPCPDAEVRRMFLFSALTGLRWSDCVRITWADVRREAGGVRVTFRQRKTGGVVYADLNAEAAELMGKAGRPGDRVFSDTYPSHVARTLRRWTEAAGIRKHVTFHTARHTFATLALAGGADLYTVSRMLGHRSIATTQIYARVMDAARREAVERLPRIL